jgi:mannose-1-phosphate guanylyltransferase
MKGLILVGGYGTRLRPLTAEDPKPTVEFANKPSVIHQIEALVKVGVTEVVLAVSYQSNVLAECVDQWVKKLALQVKITYSVETTPLGTAGPLALAREHLKDDLFFVLNSDVICPFPFEEMIQFHLKRKAEGTVVVTKVDEPSKYGVVVSNADGQIERFVEKPQTFISNKINAGMYIFSPAILDRIKPQPTSIEKEVFPVMAKEGKLFCYQLQGFWMDIGQPRDFLAGIKLYLAHQLEHNPAMLAKASQYIEPVIVHPTAKVGEGCLIGPNVCIGENCVIESGVRIRDSSVFSGTQIGANSIVKGSILGWKCTLGKWNWVEGLTILSKDIQVSDELYLNGASVLPHKSITSSVPKPQIIL